MKQNARKTARSDSSQEHQSRAGVHAGARKSLGKSRVHSAETAAENPVRQVALVGPRRDPNRNERGQFTKDNNGHLETGVHSAKRWAELAPMLQADRVAILDAKGHTERDADPVMVRIVDAFNQSVVMMNSYFEFLSSTGGPISVKGRTRRAVEGWSRAADRVAKFASMLGLERRPRVVHQTAREWLESLDTEAQQHDGSPNDNGETGETDQTE